MHTFLGKGQHICVQHKPYHAHSRYVKHIPVYNQCMGPHDIQLYTCIVHCYIEHWNRKATDYKDHRLVLFPL